MPHPDAASRKHPIRQTKQAACTGCRIKVRHDGYRPPGLWQDVHMKCYGKSKRLCCYRIHQTCGWSQDTAKRIAKGRQWHAKRPPFRS